MGRFEYVIKDIHPDAPLPLNHLEDRLRSNEADVAVMTTGELCRSPRVVCLTHEVELFDSKTNKEHLYTLTVGSKLSVPTLAVPGANVAGQAVVTWKEAEDGWQDVTVDHFVPVSYKAGEFEGEFTIGLSSSGRNARSGSSGRSPSVCGYTGADATVVEKIRRHHAGSTCIPIRSAQSLFKPLRD